MKNKLRVGKLEDRYPVSSRIREILADFGQPYYAKDSVRAGLGLLAGEEDVSEHEIRESLLNEVTLAFEDVLHTMLIDTTNDPNSMDTPRRLAKMYMLELMSGRYEAPPKVTSFPNLKTDDGEECASEGSEAGVYHFNNLLVVQAPFISVCSHHWQPVRGTAYIGVIPGDRVIGLSKYTRIVRHLAARGTLQEELTVEIADSISEYCGTDNVGVVVFARHGCCENRGISVPNSQTSTAEMRGMFMGKSQLREELYDNIKMMREEVTR